MKLSLQDQLLLAPQVAARAHRGQKRKDGTPYVAHPTRVALRVTELYTPRSPDCLRAMIVSFLHDVIEDTETTLEELRELGFSEEVLAAIDSVTRRPGEVYLDFIRRVRGDGLNPVALIAISVKLADIDDNLGDQSALDPDEAAFLRRRYTAARKILKERVEE